MKTQIKVYASFQPASTGLLPALLALSPQAVTDNEDPWVWQEDDMLRISFEGAYFPVDDVLDVLQKGLSLHSIGKMDVLLMDEWQLHRHIWQGGAFTVGRRSLNHVMDHSGL